MPRLTNPKFVQQLTKIPWVSWTPTVSSDSGPLTHTLVYAEYLKFGKLVHYIVAFSIGANGSGNIRITTPSGLTPITNASGTGREYIGSGWTVSSLVITSGEILVLRHNASTAAVSGYGLILNGFYKVA